MNLKKRIIGILAVISIVVSACSVQVGNSTDIVTSVYSIEWIYKYIGGEDLNIKSIYPSNIEPHDYELTSVDLQEALDAKEFVYVSNNLETFAKTIERDSKQTELDVINISKSLEDQIGSQFYTNGVVNDPHLWISPKKSILIAGLIYDNLKELYPDQEAIYTENYASLIKQLEILDKEYQDFAKNQKTPIIVTHDAYYWLREDYGIDVRGMYGLDHHDEPSSKELAAAVSEIKDQNIKKVYVELGDEENNLMIKLAQEAGIEVGVLNNFEMAITGHDDFLEELDKNVQAMEEA